MERRRIGSRFAVLAVGLAVGIGGAGCSAAATDRGAGGDDTSDSRLANAPIANFHEVRDGLYRGGHPDGKGLDYLKKLGVKTIVDLEIGDFIEAFPWDIDDEEDGAKSRGITLVRYPMSAFEAAASDRFDHQMDDVLARLDDAQQQPIYVHCKHGQDRTGLVIGLERVLDEGWQPEDAYDEMLDLGFHPMFFGLDEYFHEKTGWDDDRPTQASKQASSQTSSPAAAP